MKVRLTSKSAGYFALLTVLVLGSVQAAADDPEQIVRIATVDAQKNTRYILAPKSVAEQFHVFRSFYKDEEDIDLTDHSSFLSYSYESLSKLFAYVESNPNNDIACYEEQVKYIKDEGEIIQLWRALDYLDGPENLRIVVANYLLANDWMRDLTKGEQLSPINTINSALSLYNALNSLFKKRGAIEHGTLDLSRSNIYCKGIKVNSDEKQCLEVNRVSLGDNILESWNSDLSNVITHVAPNARSVNLSNNRIRNVQEGSFDELPEGCEINLSNNCLDNNGISDATCRGGRGMTIDLRNNRISENKGIELKRSARKMLLLQVMRHYMWGNRKAANTLALMTTGVSAACVTIYVGSLLGKYLLGKYLEKYKVSLPESLVGIGMGFLGQSFSWGAIQRTFGAQISEFFFGLGKEYRPNRVILKDDDLPSDDELLSDDEL